MKSVSHLPTKIDVVKFDVTNNFEMWRCEVIDALTASNLEDSLCLEEKLEETFEKDWDKMIGRRVASSGLINSKQTLNYNDVSAALVNYEVRKKNKQSFSKSDSAEVLMVRCRSSSKNGKSNRGRSNSRLDSEI